MTGLLFDIKEFSVHDGPGARITVFCKGCPLRCEWCHNPEGLSPQPQLMQKTNLCLHCGLCTKEPVTPAIQQYGKDPARCPQGALSLSGTPYTSEALVQALLPYQEMLKHLEGGITFSGGEPLMQWEFVLECTRLLKQRGFHVAIQTSGHAASEVFEQVCSQMDLVMMDLKLMEDSAHKKHTGVSNRLILENARWLQTSAISHCFRTPLIPEITDTAKNLSQIKSFVGNSPWETLPYNPLAGAKYEQCNMEFTYKKGNKQ